jgi:hypothetical protein
MGRSEMRREVSPKVKLTPNGTPPVRQNTWQSEADKCDDDSMILWWYLFFFGVGQRFLQR